MKNKKWLIIGAVILVLAIVGSFIKDDPKEENNKEVTQKKNEDIDVSNLELSDSKYIGAIKSSNKYIGDVKVDGDKVTVIFKDDMPILNEKNMVKKFAIDGVDVFQKAFENTKAKNVELIARTKFTNNEGKEEVKDAINVMWTREISDNTDYSKYKDILYKDYTKFYMMSESFTIHPAIWGQLDQEDKDNMSI